MINIENIDDNKCFKWFLVRYLHPADHYTKRITKAGKDFAKRFDFRDIEFPVIVRYIHKIEKTSSTGIIVFGYENKEKHPNYVSENAAKTNMLIYY